MSGKYDSAAQKSRFAQPNHDTKIHTKQTRFAGTLVTALSVVDSSSHGLHTRYIIRMHDLNTFLTSKDHRVCVGGTTETRAEY